jgi:AbrB family looped-hinge helix DNA binding protein
MTLTISVKLSKKGQLIIPKEMREAIGVKEGEKLLVTLKGTRIVLTKPREYGRRTRGLLKGTWGRNERAVGDYLKKERLSWG